MAKKARGLKKLHLKVFVGLKMVVKVLVHKENCTNFKIQELEEHLIDHIHHSARHIVFVDLMTRRQNSKIAIYIRNVICVIN